MDSVNLGLLASFVFLLFFIYLKNTRKNFPPGPKGWPILGNVEVAFSNFDKLHTVFLEYSKKYGNIFYFKIGLGGAFDTIVLNDIDAVEEAFVQNQNDFSGRTRSWAFENITMGGKDIAFADYGQDFKSRKNLASKGLRQFLGGKNLEKKVNNAVSLSMRYFEEYAANKKEFDPNKHLSLIVQNIICGMVFGRQFEIDDKEFNELIALFKAANEEVLHLKEEFLPGFVVKFWISNHGKFFLELIEKVFNYERRMIKEHIDNFDSECPPRDIVDYLLLNRDEKQISESGEEMRKLDDEELLLLCHDLFIAGTDTSTTTLTWIILFLALHQDSQEKVFQEIRNVIGTENDIQLTDQSRMPYSKAFQMESMRLGMAVPLGLPHETICDTKLRGYEIPKGTTVTVNHYALHRDPKEWKNPEMFNPERFLEEDGSIIAKPRSWLPFSAGRRACVGENVAKAQVFIVWVSILQKFKISLPKGDTPSLEQRFFPSVPHPYKIILEVRD